jgi:hypothetical protein
MLALHHAAGRKRAFHLPNTPEFPPLASCHYPHALGHAPGQGKPRVGNWVTPLSLSLYQWRLASRSDMAQSKKSVLCLSISCGIMARQATRITAYDIWELKQNPGLGGGEVWKIFCLICVWPLDNICGPWAKVFSSSKNILRVTANFFS